MRKMANWTASLDILYDMGAAGLQADLPLDCHVTIVSSLGSFATPA